MPSCPFPMAGKSSPSLPSASISSYISSMPSSSFSPSLSLISVIPFRSVSPSSTSSVARKKSFRCLEGRHFDAVSEYRRPLDAPHRILLRAKDSTWAFKKKCRREFSSQGSGTTIAKLQVQTERI
jgi:hypothetical protein